MIIILCGNDGTGKTTLVKHLNALKNTSIKAIERSSIDQIEGVNAKILDQKTLENTFDRPANGIEDLPRQTADGTPIAYVIIDVDVETSIQRLQQRDARDEWETPKALFYFRQRFRELAAFYGLPIVRNQGCTISEAANAVIRVAKNSELFRSLAIRTLDYDAIQARDVEAKLMPMMPSRVPFDFRQEWWGSVTDDDLKRRLYARYVVTHGQCTVEANQIVFTVPEHKSHEKQSASEDDKQQTFVVEYEKDCPLLQLVVEGESKRVYKVLSPLYDPTCCFIKLKSTIYSHKKQATGEIKHLAEVRAAGSQLFLEMMARNNLCHAYRSIGTTGVCAADFVEDIPPTEIVVKRYCLGTDKHCFYGALEDDEIVISETGEYRQGPYVRFDWRNPNHVHRKTRQTPLISPYYYLVEENFGKEQFFERFLSGPDSLFKPVGDMATTDAVVSARQDTDRARKTVMQMFLTTQAYLNHCGLVIQDVCYMTDRDGTRIWSEVNQDCCRLKAQENATDAYDKDIWRAGGSSSKDQIMAKWRAFNKMLGDVLRDRPFHETEMLEEAYPYEFEANRILTDQRLRVSQQYQRLLKSLCGTTAQVDVKNANLKQQKSSLVQENASADKEVSQLSKHKHRRRVILTVDLYNGEPVLVRKGRVTEAHSDGDVERALQRINVFSDLLMVDLNGAFGEAQPSPNRSIIKQYAKRYYVHAGGGLRTLKDIQDVLESSARRVAIGTTTDEAFLAKLPKDRLIVEVSVNQHLKVMTHGRKQQTTLDVGDELTRLAQAGVQVISVTFHETEGGLKGLPREQVESVVSLVPSSIEKIIIAGGISSMEDVQYLWSLDARVVPQLGSAVWKQRIGVGELMAATVRFDENTGLAPAIIQDKNGRVKGLVWMNEESVRRSAEERVLYRYSRQHGRLMQKGANVSGDIQKVLKISPDCDSDSMLITVDCERSFCHIGNASCFSLQTVIKANLGTLNDYLRSRRGDASYTAYMQRNPGLALAKLQEELWEVAAAGSSEERVHECADLLVHLLMFANGQGIYLDDLLNELNARRWNPRLMQTVVSTSDQRTMQQAGVVTVAVTASKYTEKTDSYALNTLGVQIVRPPHKSREMWLEAKIVDEAKFRKAFGNDVKRLQLVTSRPKDMAFLLSRGRIDACITYNATMLNFPAVAQEPVAEWPDDSLRLCLIQRKNAKPMQWSATNKGLIAAEHVLSVSAYLSQHYDSSVFTLDRVVGASEGYLINDSNRHYDMCDAIVETGATLRENNLEIAEEILPRGEVKLGLYFALKRRKH